MMGQNFEESPSQNDSAHTHQLFSVDFLHITVPHLGSVPKVGEWGSRAEELREIYPWVQKVFSKSKAGTSRT